MTSAVNVGHSLLATMRAAAGCNMSMVQDNDDELSMSAIDEDQ